MLNYYDRNITFPKMTESLFDDISEKRASLKPHCLIFATDENACLLYKTLLKNWNYEVMEAACVEAAIDLTKLRQPDIVLMETEINFHESLAIMKELKAELENIPFILLSGHAQSEIRQSAIAAGATAFCVKPINFSVLESVLENCLNND